MQFHFTPELFENHHGQAESRSTSVFSDIFRPGIFRWNPKHLLEAIMKPHVLGIDDEPYIPKTLTFCMEAEVRRTTAAGSAREAMPEVAGGYLAWNRLPSGLVK